MAEAESYAELAQLLKSLPPKHPLVTITLRSLSTATCSTTALTALAEHPGLMNQLIGMLNFTEDSANTVLNQDCLLQVLVNVSSADSWSDEVFAKLREAICLELAAFDQRPLLGNSALLDKMFAILSNLSRRQLDALEVFNRINAEKLRLFVTKFDAANRDPAKSEFQFLPSLFVNLSAVSEFRKVLMDDSRLVIQRLLPFMDTKFPLAVRGAVMRLVRNCTFDSEFHQWLLGPKVSLLSYLLLPLAGPEEFDEEDTDKLPVDLQFLPAEKTREPDADLRVVLLESLLQLCCTEFGRHFLRDHGGYLILREFHKWETNPAVRYACENAVDPLISDEPLDHMKDLKRVDVPDHLVQEFNQINKTLQEPYLSRPGSSSIMARGALKDGDKPRGKMSAYAFFLQICREDHKKKHPNDQVNFAEFSKKCAEKWKGLTDKEKTRFHDLAAGDKARFEKDMAGYVPPEGSGRSGKRKRGKKDPNAPKRALSAFFWFCNDERPKVRAIHSNMAVGDVAKELGKKWALVSAADKVRYEQLAAKDRERYQKEIAEYKASLGLPVKRGPGASAAGPPRKAALPAAQEASDDDDEEEDSDDE
ncbi:High mobility group protein DSP1 [Hypsibius exemplaris]|uniref:High mobility group protein DSP1 n=1 Tax=Hypsibius exemplaris TaxID=2072580 RepID=A0A1W0WMA9_HYPEX|nr:High mobility group protein DSP1 [Hypsibius exemplaris]